MALASGIALNVATDEPAKSVAAVGAKAPADPAAQLEYANVPDTAEATKKYWTKARLRAAKPLDTPAVNAAPAAPQASALGTGPTLEGEGTLPEGAAATRSGGTASTQAVRVARQWTRHNAAPARTIGKLYGVNNRGQQYTCSASVINAKNKRTIWTAGHCVHSGRGGTAGFARKLVFYPDFIDGRSKGVWTADRIVALKGWTTKGDLRYDIAAFTVRTYKGKGVQAYTGAQGFTFGYKGRAYNVYSFGYPARALPSKRPMNSNRLWYCSGKSYGVNYGGGAVGLGMHCTMGNGASGGPWIYGMSRKGYGRIIGINSTHSLRTDQMNSPHHGTVAINVYKAIAG
ncbi:trypsin-like serine peptidase [Spirillospora sp. CA-294931]|uniref:trypsin-like serine peptidase n=1 Tax=Spirillospora sp. CA-294931 TaxID=3240042 RepID=UPI003D8DFCC7